MPSIADLRPSQVEILSVIKKIEDEYTGKIVPLKDIISKAKQEDVSQNWPQLAIQNLYDKGWLKRPLRGGYRLSTKARQVLKEIGI